MIMEKTECSKCPAVVEQSPPPLGWMWLFEEMVWVCPECFVWGVVEIMPKTNKETIMKPYYQDKGVGVYHSGKVGGKVWTVAALLPIKVKAAEIFFSAEDRLDGDIAKELGVSSSSIRSWRRKWRRKEFPFVLRCVRLQDKHQCPGEAY